MARPSQCRVCGCFSHCLYRGARGCAEDSDNPEMHARELLERVDENGNPI